MNHNALGKLGEKTAAEFLKKIGYKILDCNFQNSQGRRKGELDIIAKDSKNKEIVFVEVKSRTKKAFFETIPEENITRSKLVKLQKIAQIYLRHKKWQCEPYRFDAISIVFEENDSAPKINHIIGL